MSVELTRERVVEINAAAWEYWRWSANEDEDWTRAYLARRGLRGLQAGYAPEGWARLVGRMRGRGYSPEELVAAGLAFRTEAGGVGDVFRDRLVLPYRDETGAIIGFTARRNPATDGVDDAPAKYLNTTSTSAFDKSRDLYGLDPAAVRRIQAGARVVFVEGALDVEAIRRTGSVVVPVSGCGTALTATHLVQLRAIQESAVALGVFAFDADDAGRAAAARVWDLLTDDEAGTAGALVLPDGTDPAQLVQDSHGQALAERLSRPQALASVVVDSVLARHDLTIPEGRIAGLRAAAARVARISAVPLSRVGTHLHARLAPCTDLGVIAGELAIAAAAAHDDNT
ncbi:toprim domain-containing protein [Cellulosimicrobium sp. Marseille-Q8652]